MIGEKQNLPPLSAVHAARDRTSAPNAYYDRLMYACYILKSAGREV